MAGPHDKRRMLDDEMSRFEAEISGPNGIDMLSASQQGGMDMRPIIGSNTFAQVKQQLNKVNDDGSLQPPPVPPNFNNSNRPNIRPQMGPQMGPFSMQNQEDHIKMGPQEPHPSSPGFGPRIPPNFNQNQFRPNMNRPGPQGLQGPGPFGQNMGNMGSRNGNPPNSFPPPPPPPGFMGGPRGGGNNFSHGGMAPPPGFIPPQVNRSNMNMGPMMNNNSNNMGSPIGPRPPSSLLRPPPPPPGLMVQKMSGNSGSPKGMSCMIISKTPTVISSAPKLYLSSDSKESKSISEEKKNSLNLPLDLKKPPSDPKKKKLKAEHKSKLEKKKLEASHAVEMAEKVKQSITTTTIKQAVHTFHHPPHQAHQPHQPHQEERKRERKPKRNLRYAGGQVWEDACLAEWDPDDFRMFAGDLGNDVTDELLHRYFCHYPSFVKAKVVRDKRTNKSKGYGFISFKDSQDYIRAMKEMNGKYLGSRPIKLRKSMWKDRNLDVVQKKLKEKQLLGLK